MSMPHNSKDDNLKSLPSKTLDSTHISPKYSIYHDNSEVEIGDYVSNTKINKHMLGKHRNRRSLIVVGHCPHNQYWLLNSCKTCEE